MAERLFRSFVCLCERRVGERTHASAGRLTSWPLPPWRAIEHLLGFRFLASGDTNNRFFLLRDAGEVTVKLYEILVEFFVIFFTTSAIIFNIEHAVNPEFGDLGDSLYWSFLTLTGNEQPFDVRSHPPHLFHPSPHYFPGKKAATAALLAKRWMLVRTANMDRRSVEAPPQCVDSSIALPPVPHSYFSSAHEA